MKGNSQSAKNANFELIRARQDTPGCENRIHFNNAGAALMPLPVSDALLQHLQREIEIGGYEALLEAESRDAHVYHSIASLLNCTPPEIAIIENATRAWDMAFYSIPFQKGDRILTSVSEYASNYIAYLQIASKIGLEIHVIPNDEAGQISIDALQDAIKPGVKLISITHVPTNSGLVNPAEAVGQVAKKAGVLYLLDACQSVGQMPIDVQKIGCDFLSATGRKYLRGPRGTGFLYVRKDQIQKMEPVFLDLHAARWTSRDQYEIRNDAKRFENWETNYAGKLALGVAADYAMDQGLPVIWNRIQTLATRLRAGLRLIKNVTVRDPGIVQCGIVSFTVEGKEPKEIRKTLWERKMNVWVSPLHYTRLDMESRGLDQVVRASVHYYNSEKEVDQFLDVISGL